MLLLLPVVTRKLKRSMPSLLPHPPVLAHTIYQAITFDGALREEGFDLSGTSAEVSQGINEWKGTGDTVLGRSDWFNAWLQGEKQCTSFTHPGKLSFEGSDSRSSRMTVVISIIVSITWPPQSPWTSTMLRSLRATLGGWPTIKGMNRPRNKTCGPPIRPDESML